MYVNIIITVIEYVYCDGFLSVKKKEWNVVLDTFWVNMNTQNQTMLKNSHFTYTATADIELSLVNDFLWFFFFSCLRFHFGSKPPVFCQVMKTDKLSEYEHRKKTK